MILRGERVSAEGKRAAKSREAALRRRSQKLTINYWLLAGPLPTTRAILFYLAFDPVTTQNSHGHKIIIGISLRNYFK